MSEPLLTEPQQELLMILVRADRAVREKSGESDRFAWHTQGGMGPTELLHGGAEPGQTVDTREMVALIDRGLLTQRGQRAADLTNEGLRVGGRLERECSLTAALDPSWEEAEKVLGAMWQEWVARGAPSIGVPVADIAAQLDDDPRRTERLLELLADDGWAEARAQGSVAHGHEGATYVPTARALQQFGGWPAPGASLLERFLEALDAAAAETDDPEERSRLAAVRDAAGRITESTLAAVLARLASGGIHRL